MKIILAQIISAILSPVVWMPILILLIIFKSGLSIVRLQMLLPLLLLFYVVIPFGYIGYLFFKGKIKDLDLTVRKERLQPLLVSLFSIIFGTLISYLFGNKLIFSYSVLILIVLIINLLITVRWKISLHATVNVIGCLTINYIFNWRYLMLFITLPLVFWARLVLKKHTILQLLAGFVINGILFILVLKFSN